MRSKTKTRLLLTAFILIVLGWAFPEWRPHGFAIPYYEETAAHLRALFDELQPKFASARTSSYGVFVEQNIAAIGGIYALLALLWLSQRQYRDKGWEHLGALCFGFMALAVWFVIGDWIAITCHKINDAHGGHWAFQRGLGLLLISIVTGIIWPLLTIALGLTLWIGVPLYLLVLLFLLPSVLYVILRLVVQLPFLTYHYLHYLTVPHPAESAYRAGMANDLPIPDLASSVADVMYRYGHLDYAALPPVWKSKNQKKRIAAFRERLQAEDRFMEELIKNLRLRSQLYE
jgi:hypothetical protein